MFTQWSVHTFTITRILLMKTCSWFLTVMHVSVTACPRPANLLFPPQHDTHLQSHLVPLLMLTLFLWFAIKSMLRFLNASHILHLHLAVFFRSHSQGKNARYAWQECLLCLEFFLPCPHLPLPYNALYFFFLCKFQPMTWTPTLPFDYCRWQYQQ